MDHAIVSNDICSDDIGCVVHASRIEVDSDVFTIKCGSCQAIRKIGRKYDRSEGVIEKDLVETKCGENMFRVSKWATEDIHWQSD